MYSKAVVASGTGDVKLLDHAADGGGPGSSVALSGNQYFRIHALSITQQGDTNLQIFDGPSSGNKLRRNYTFKSGGNVAGIAEPPCTEGYFDCANLADLIAKLSIDVGTYINISYSVQGFK